MAAKLYASSPEALQAACHDIIYETTKERGATILMPTSMVDAMNPGAASFALHMAGGSTQTSKTPRRTTPAKRQLEKTLRLGNIK